MATPSVYPHTSLVEKKETFLSWADEFILNLNGYIFNTRLITHLSIISDIRGYTNRKITLFFFFWIWRIFYYEPLRKNYNGQVLGPSLSWTKIRDAWYEDISFTITQKEPTWPWAGLGWPEYIYIHIQKNWDRRSWHH